MIQGASHLPVEEMLGFYLPYLIQAGEYALRIQSRVASQPSKVVETSTAMSEALTDADLSIQNLFESRPCSARGKRRWPAG